MHVHDTVLTEFVDPYLNPETGLLHNKTGARTKVALDEIEGDLTLGRAMQLLDRPQEGTGDLDELCSIHHRLFQDIYSWAGQLRTVDVRKNVEGAEFFLPVSMITRAATFAAAELQAENSLQDMARDTFIARLAFHYDQFNYIHPFREGNGRTQRFFWNRIARDAGWQLDWQSVHGSTNDAACRAASDQQDMDPLLKMFDQIVTKAAPPTHRDDSWRNSEVSRLSFLQPVVPPAQAPKEGTSISRRTVQRQTPPQDPNSKSKRGLR